MKKIILFVCAIWATTSLAARFIPQKESKVLLTVPYTMGKHELEGQGFLGSVDFDEKALLISEGKFTLRVDQITGKKQTLVCHLNESLTLDYDKSDFPEDHVCDDDKLPSDGKNAPVYPEIEAQLLKPISIEATTMSVRWTIHGVTREQEIPVTILWDKATRRLTLSSVLSMSLKDYGITVKKFLFIGVDDKIPLTIQLALGEK